MDINTTAERVWSKQQTDIFSWFKDRKVNETEFSNLIVEALAGTGKTTTIIKAIDFAPEQRILLCAFNKKIAEELTARLNNPNAEAKTLHAIGFSIVRRYRPSVKVLKGSERADWLTHTVCPKAPDTIKKLISRLHTLGREINPHAAAPGSLIAIAENFQCEPDEAWISEGYDTEYVEQYALKAMELASNDVTRGIDYSDMIFLPVRNHWMAKQYDLVVVDEAQDMTVAQLEIAQGVCGGRICVVGDPNQAIYGFRGADSGSMGRLQTELHAGVLGLTTTYRCGKRIVALAQSLVPTFEAGHDNPEGEVLALHTQKLTATADLGDFILSRVNAPLVSTAMSLLRGGKRARIAGRDIGAGIKALMFRLAKGPASNSIPALLVAIGRWEKKEIERAEAAGKPERIDAVRDQADMLVSLSDGAKSVRDIADRIDALFTDDGLGQAGVVTCSSVHRAKGLEANRVFVLSDTLREFNQEELNIQYVAYTRAKQTLVLVSEKVTDYRVGVSGALDQKVDGSGHVEGQS